MKILILTEIISNQKIFTYFDEIKHKNILKY